MPLDIIVSKEKYVDLISFLKNDERTNLKLLYRCYRCRLGSHFDVITQLMSIEKGHKFFVRVFLYLKTIPKKKKNGRTSILAEIPSILPSLPC
jgi:NADH:ubiquinone oxidoreductase subunit C